jgi:glycosyltransferase involved in cell wall biosynthesis
MRELNNLSDALFLFPTASQGGAETVTRLLVIEALRSARYRKVVGLVFRGRDEHVFEEASKYDNFELVYLDAETDIQTLRYFLSYIWRRKFALIFSSHTHFNAMCSFLKSLGILKTDVLISRESTQIFERPMGSRGKLAKLLYSFYGSQDLIVCQTEKMSKSLTENTKHKFENITITLPNPVSIASSSLKENREHVVQDSNKTTSIAWCGRFIDVKKPLAALEVLSVLRASGLDVDLTMVGDGQLKQIAERRCSDLGLTQFVSFVGLQKTPRTFFENCDIGLISSISEGFPNVLLEMMASRMKHIVCTPCAGGLDEIPQISLAESFEAEELASLVDAAIRTRRDDCLAYSKHLESRMPADYFNNLLAFASKGKNMQI